MRRSTRPLLWIVAILATFFQTDSALAQDRTIGLIANDSANTFKGYTLFNPLASTQTYLIDMNGNLVHSWSSHYPPGQSVRLLPDGNLLRAAMVRQGNPFQQGGVGGRVEILDWDGNVVWSFEHFGANYSAHHDIEYLPNGNILMIAWEKKTRDEAISAGRNPANIQPDSVLWSEKLIEVHPTDSSGGEIVWEWHIWDHLVQNLDSTQANYGVVSEHPELFNINFGPNRTDFLHFNAVRYNAERDEIIVSVHTIHEVWIIDHSTTTAEAAGHDGGRRDKGGDLIYRWGNPQAYGRGNAASQKLFAQHDARWIDAGLPGEGNILIFNNGTRRPDGNYSSVEQIVPPIGDDGNYTLEQGAAYGPTETVWSFHGTPPDSFYSVNISGATRMPNGNTLVCLGAKGKFHEVTPDGRIVWTYVNPVTATGIAEQGQTPVRNEVFKIYRYAPDFPGLAGKELVSQGPIERENDVAIGGATAPNHFALLQNYPNPFNARTQIQFDLPLGSIVTLNVFNTLGGEVAVLQNGYLAAGSHEIEFKAEHLSAGVYCYILSTNDFTTMRKMVLLK